ncbi:hypothetical protein [Chryseobacterium sp. 2R14A]|uniref:hypothetical protein n=1 Tax=Chryseobacterium sp. 2R14A TaxID=3380353 RepID=UPI003CF02C70
MTKNKELHQRFLEEIDKMILIAEMQKKEEIITRQEYRKIMFLLIDKTESYLQNLEKVEIPDIQIKNYREINLLSLTDIMFCTG